MDVNTIIVWGASYISQRKHRIPGPFLSMFWDRSVQIFRRNGDTLRESVTKDTVVNKLAELLRLPS